MKIIVFLVAPFLFMFSPKSKEYYSVPSNVDGIMSSKHAPANDVNEFLSLIANMDVPVIRSLKDFEKVAKMPESPFKALSPRALNDFKSSLKFNKTKGGIASFKYTDLKATLTPSAYLKALEMFGISEAMADDNQGYACVGVGDCATNQTHICTSNC